MRSRFVRFRHLDSGSMDKVMRCADNCSGDWTSSPAGTLSTPPSPPAGTSSSSPDSAVWPSRARHSTATVQKDTKTATTWKTRRTVMSKIVSTSTADSCSKNDQKHDNDGDDNNNNASFLRFLQRQLQQERHQQEERPVPWQRRRQEEEEQQQRPMSHFSALNGSPRPAPYNIQHQSSCASKRPKLLYRYLVRNSWPASGPGSVGNPTVAPPRTPGRIMLCSTYEQQAKGIRR